MNVNTNMNYNFIMILGPTASGKTLLSVELAKKLNTEIINADSMQIYKNLNIGTAKPTLKEQGNIKHHLLDFLEPANEYSVSNFKEDASKIIKQLNNTGKTPIVVGGTGFFLESLLSNYSYGNAVKNDFIRQKYMNLKEEHGNEYIYDILKKIDPQTAEKLHPNDFKRVIRALEIFEVCGKTKFEMEQQNKQTTSTEFKPYIIGLTMPREMLYEKINLRVDKMIEDGLVAEVEELINQGLTTNNQCMKGIGYKELIDYFNNKQPLDICVEKIKQASRNYAKRQMTWFGHMENIHWFDVSTNSIQDIINEILTDLKK